MTTKTMTAPAVKANESETKVSTAPAAQKAAAKIEKIAIKQQEKASSDTQEVSGGKGSDVEKGSIQDSKVDMLGDKDTGAVRKLDLSTLIKGNDKVIAVKLKFTDTKILDKIKMEGSQDKVIVVYDNDKISLAGSSEDVKALLSRVLFDSSEYQQNFRFEMNVSNGNTSYSESLFVKFDTGSTDLFSSFKYSGLDDTAFKSGFFNSVESAFDVSSHDVTTPDNNFTVFIPQIEAASLATYNVDLSVKTETVVVQEPVRQNEAPTNITPPVINNNTTTTNNTNTSSSSSPPSPTNAAPINTLPATYTTNEDINAALTGISVADSDTATPASVTIASTNGILNIATGVAGGITAGMISGNGTATLTITGATLTQINATLVDAAGLTFVPTANYNGSAVVTVTTNDGTLTDVDTSTITVNAVNDAPVLSGVDATTAYTQNGAAVVIDSTINTPTDVDDTNIESATVAIIAGGDFVAAGGIDTLNYSTMHGVTGVYDAATGIMTLTGTATLAQYEQILESITFSSTSATTGNRTISYTINDGTDNSNTQTATINYTLAAVNSAPVLSDVGAVTNYTQNATAVAIDSSTTIVDTDDTNI